MADALELGSDSYDIRSNRGGVAVSGEVTLHAEEIWVQLSLGALGPGHEVMFRRVTGRRDHTGDRNRWASVGELLAPDRFAARIRQELRLEPASRPANRLFA